MSWSCTYYLPWPTLHDHLIESAIEIVLQQLPFRERQSEIQNRNSWTILWNLEVFPDEEIRWTVLGDPETLFRQYDIGPDDSLWITIHFHTIPNEVPSQTWFGFDTSHSANRMMNGCCLHVCELLARHFGVECAIE